MLWKKYLAVSTLFGGACSEECPNTCYLASYFFKVWNISSRLIDFKCALSTAVTKRKIEWYFTNFSRDFLLQNSIWRLEKCSRVFQKVPKNRDLLVNPEFRFMVFAISEKHIFFFRSSRCVHGLCFSIHSSSSQLRGGPLEKRSSCGRHFRSCRRSCLTFQLLLISTTGF